MLENISNQTSVSVFLSGWKSEFGGFTSYIAHDEDEEVGDGVTQHVCFHLMIYYNICKHGRLVHIIYFVDTVCFL